MSDFWKDLAEFVIDRLKNLGEKDRNNELIKKLEAFINEDKNDSKRT